MSAFVCFYINNQLIQVNLLKTGRNLLLNCYFMRKKAVLPITKTRLFKYNENFTIKNENFQMKNSGSFHSSAQNIYCGYFLEPPTRGGSNEYSQSMFLNRNKKINVYPCKPQFYCIK